MRGISPGLDVAAINGVSIPSPESDTRAVALDVLPAELVERLEVAKSLTPDMDADAIGAAINVTGAASGSARTRPRGWTAPRTRTA